MFEVGKDVSSARLSYRLVVVVLSSSAREPIRWVRISSSFSSSGCCLCSSPCRGATDVALTHSSFSRLCCCRLSFAATKT